MTIYSESIRNMNSSLIKRIKELKTYLIQYISSKVPGYLPSLDVLSKTIHNKGFIDLFLESPSKAYRIILKRYLDTSTADFVMLTLFIRPILVKLNRLGYEEELLNAVKNNQDEEFLKFIRSALMSTE